MKIEKDPTVKEILYAHLKIANLQSWLDCFEHSATEEEIKECKDEIEQLRKITN